MKRKAWLAGWPSPLGRSGITERVHTSAASSGVRLMQLSFSRGAAASVGSHRGCLDVAGRDQRSPGRPPSQRDTSSQW